jgi:hypothetical protein
MGACPDDQVSFGRSKLGDLREESRFANPGLAKHVNPMRSLRSGVAVFANESELFFTTDELPLGPECRIERRPERAVAPESGLGSGEPTTTFPTEVLRKGSGGTAARTRGDRRATNPHILESAAQCFLHVSRELVPIVRIFRESLHRHFSEAIWNVPVWPHFPRIGNRIV